MSDGCERSVPRASCSPSLCTPRRRSAGQRKPRVPIRDRRSTSGARLLGDTCRRGHGLAVRATSLLCEWAFRALSLTRIELLIEPENASSHRLAERRGAVRGGSHDPRGEWRDVGDGGHVHAVSPEPTRHRRKSLTALLDDETEQSTAGNEVWTSLRISFPHPTLDEYGCSGAGSSWWRDGPAGRQSCTHHRAR